MKLAYARPYMAHESLNRFIQQTNFTVNPYAFFFPAAALALAAFFLLLRTITTPRKLPTTADPRRMSIKGMRIAHTRGGIGREEDGQGRQMASHDMSEHEDLGRLKATNTIASVHMV